MNQNKLPKRKNNRIKDYDYSKEGYYFITICTKDKIKCLSSVGVRFHPDPNGNLYYTKNTIIGEQIEKTIIYLNEKYKSNMNILDYIIMPNHIHLIINITGKGGTLPLQQIIIELKTYTNRKYVQLINENKKLWQRNYYEHIIRNEKEYLRIKEYIINNPVNWAKDEYF